MNELALFAGAGGGILGGQLLGWHTVAAVEWEPYAASILAARQNDGLLPPFPIWDDVQTFDGRPFRGLVDVVSGGFPCQDISVAGKGAGIDGQRSGMWQHMARIVGEVRPRFVYVENSPALITRGLGRVLSDLATLGYDCRWTVLGAADVGAPHQRDRFWLVANATGEQHQSPPHAQQRQASAELSADANQQRCDRWAGTFKTRRRPEPSDTCISLANTDGHRQPQPKGREQEERRRACNCGGHLAHANRERLEERENHRCNSDEEQPATPREGAAENPQRQRDGTEKHGEEIDRPQADGSTSWIGRSSWWLTEPDVGRVANGVEARVDRLKALGNGQVPLCAATAWRILTGDQ